MKKIVNSDVKLGATLLLFCLWVWFYAIPTQIKGDTQQLYPRFVTLFIVVPSLLILFRGLKAGFWKTGPQTFLDILKESRRSIAAIAMMVLYAVSMEYVGYYASSAAAGVAFMLFMGVRWPLPLILIPAGLLLAVNIVIERILQFPLPGGVFF